MMAELDPMFVKSLKLLHSNHPDSTEALKSLLINAIKKEDLKLPTELFNFNIKTNKNKTSRSKLCHNLKKDTKEKIDSISDEDRSSKTLPVKNIAVDKSVNEEIWNAAAVRDEDEMAFEIMESLTCVKCRGLDVAPGNQLIECQECHCLYHQECHIPIVTDDKINDPRLVWFCYRCQNELQKKNSKILVKAGTSSSNVQTLLPNNSWSNNVKGMTTPSKESGHNSASKHPFANLTGSKTKYSHSINKLNNIQGNSSLITADKRLQIMKRKAAAKIQEKRLMK